MLTSWIVRRGRGKSTSGILEIQNERGGRRVTISRATRLGTPKRQGLDQIRKGAGPNGNTCREVGSRGGGGGGGSGLRAGGE